mgnify:CR=1 FL=1
MKTYSSYESLPKQAHYIGSQFGDGSIDESLADCLELAVNPIRLREPDGTYSYFDVLVQA